MGSAGGGGVGTLAAGWACVGGGVGFGRAAERRVDGGVPNPLAG